MGTASYPARQLSQPAIQLSSTARRKGQWPITANAVPNQRQTQFQTPEKPPCLSEDPTGAHRIFGHQIQTPLQKCDAPAWGLPKDTVVFRGFGTGFASGLALRCLWFGTALAELRQWGPVVLRGVHSRRATSRAARRRARKPSPACGRHRAAPAGTTKLAPGRTFRPRAPSPGRAAGAGGRAAASSPGCAALVGGRRGAPSPGRAAGAGGRTAASAPGHAAGSGARQRLRLSAPQGEEKGPPCCWRRKPSRGACTDGPNPTPTFD